jgi:TDG/mug DNA glycosylase family protein
LLPLGLGITNLVQRASATADELSKEELAVGGERLAAKVAEYAPRMLAVLGVGAYRSAFGRPKAAMGLQAETFGSSQIWVLPNPSGLNAHYTLEGLAAVFRELRFAVEGSAA